MYTITSPVQIYKLHYVHEYTKEPRCPGCTTKGLLQSTFFYDELNLWAPLPVCPHRRGKVKGCNRWVRCSGQMGTLILWGFQGHRCPGLCESGKVPSVGVHGKGCLLLHLWEAVRKLPSSKEVPVNSPVGQARLSAMAVLTSPTEVQITSKIPG